MSRWTVFLCSLAALVISVGLAGCGGEDAATEFSPIQKALAELSEADRAAAEQQRICPVTDEPLGSMGTPVKITVKGREVFLCCAGCEGSINDDPDTYLTKLNE